MTNIIIAFSKPEDGKNMKNLLARYGFHVVAVCTNGAQALSYTEELLDGIVISGYKLNDMMFTELHESLPSNFEFLLMASERVFREYDCRGINTLAMPLKVQALIDSLNILDEQVSRRHRKLKSKPKERNPEEQAEINRAKKELMEHKNMTEEEAHRYMQKLSMNNSTSLIETARMLLALRNYN